MSKKLLSKIHDIQSSDKSIALKIGMKVSAFGNSTGKLSKQQAREEKRLRDEGKIEEWVKLLSNADVSEAYLSAPELVINKGSLKEIEVVVYSTESSDKHLLHKLYSGIE